MAFQELKIAPGWDNSDNFVNLEDVKVNGWYFAPMEDLGKWSLGDEVIRGDGVMVTQGFNSTAWLASSLSLDHWHYLYQTILGNALSGKVTIRTRNYVVATYANYNAILTLPQPQTLTKTNRWYEDVVLRYTRLASIGGFSSGFDASGISVYLG